MPRPGILPGRRALVPGRITQPVRFGIQQSVQCLLHGAPHELPEMVLDPGFIDLDHIPQLWCILLHGGGSPLWSLVFRNSN